MDKEYFLHKMVLSPPFLFRRLKGNLKYEGRRNIPCLPICCNLKLHKLECTNKQYKHCKILGYNFNGMTKTSTFHTKKQDLNNPKFTLTCFSCYESTVLYFYLYNSNSFKIFKLVVNLCNLPRENITEIENDKDILFIMYTITDRCKLHYNVSCDKIIDFSHIKRQYIESKFQDDYINYNFTFYSQNYKRHRNNLESKLNNSKFIKANSCTSIINIHDNYLSYHFCKNINSCYRDTMIKWNHLRFTSNLCTVDLIIKFTNEFIEQKDKLEFIYLFLYKRIIKKKDFIFIIQQCV